MVNPIERDNRQYQGQIIYLEGSKIYLIDDRSLFRLMPEDIARAKLHKYRGEKLLGQATYQLDLLLTQEARTQYGAALEQYLQGRAVSSPLIVETVHDHIPYTLHIGVTGRAAFDETRRTWRHIDEHIDTPPDFTLTSPEASAGLLHCLHKSVNKKKNICSLPY